MDLNAFVLASLPPAPARVLEVGCGAGVLARALDSAGYDVLAIDPDAPSGEIFRAVTLEELDDPGPFDAVVAARVLHHVTPLEPAVDKLAGLAPLLVLDEFAPERLDAAAQDWYEGQRRILAAAGAEPGGPPDLDSWREAHRDLHPSHVVLAAVRARFDERLLSWEPYLYRWLKGPASEPLERALVAAEALPALGYRFVGVRTIAGADQAREPSSATVSSQ
ncbi:MAG: class I SAM-dependent methyltransferase [Gaiellaceae bacterium]